MNEFDQNTKKQYLAELKNEVKDFHPLLMQLLPKLPRVNKVEQTHGVFEKGADFVINRLDDVLNITEYIGVIVKIGRILGDISSINGQIDDCDEFRYVENGKKNIKLDEIWVITNEHISENAKQKIYRKYSCKKIKFFQNTDIICLIDEYIPNFWYNIPIDIGEYLNKLDNQINSIDKLYNLVPQSNESFYIEQELYPYIWDYKSNSVKLGKKSKDTIFDIIEKNKIIFIEGGAGFGKSKLLRYTTQYYCRPLNYKKFKLVPIYISYKDFSELYNCKVEEVIKSAFKDYKESIDIKNSKFVMFCDGFDEKYLDNEQESEQLIELISTLKKIDNLVMVISSRPLNIIEEKKVIQSNISWFGLAPLTIPKIIKFFNTICKKTKISQRIIEDIKKSDLFKQLPKSPIAAILLANLINDNSTDLPSNLTELYQKYSELMLGRWDTYKGLQLQKEYETAINVIIRIAKFFIDNELEFLSINDAKKFFNEYLNERNLDINPDELFNRVTSRSGILQKESIYNRIYFKHKTFCEFFYALYKFRFHDDKFINKDAFNNYWRNIYFFYIGLHKDCEDILNSLLKIEPVDYSSKFIKYMSMSDYFLAGYSTPYSVVKNNLHKIIVDITKMYFDIINRKIENPFQYLPEMAILCFFQVVVRQYYSYEYFYKALEDAVLEILSNEDIPTEVKIYCIYFISVIFIDLKKENPFDGLIEKFQKEIPIQIQLAINYDIDNLENRSKILRKFEKNFINKVKDSNELKQYIHNLHSIPLHNNPLLNKEL